MSDVDLSFMPLVTDIIKSVERESHDINQKVGELKSKLQRAREQVEKLPGINYSPEEQERQIEVLRQQLIAKNDLLKKYKSMSNFEVEK